MIGRRGFLGGLAGILAAGVAPAIVSNPMKIVVPKPVVWPDIAGIPQLYPPSKHFYSYDFVHEPGIARVAAIESAIREKLRETAYRLYKESGYIGAAESINGIVVQDPTMVRYLQRRADLGFKTA